MAITKIGHIKAGKGGSSQPLKNGIMYVMNPEKTEGYLFGTNCRHTDAEGIYHDMLDVKSVWNKQGGRVGWHFIISFRKGDPKVDSGMALAVAQEFCEQYLGVNFQYVYAVHMDHEHIHAHIVFNSVSAVDGHKYHYADGDWERYIQPVTNEICRKHGLDELTIVPDAQREKGRESGVPYVEWAAAHGRGISWRKMLRDKIDLILPHVKNVTGLVGILKFQGYEVKQGGVWLSIKIPGCQTFIRTTSLGKGYSLVAMEARCNPHPDYNWPENPRMFLPPRVKHCKFTKYNQPYLSSWQKQQIILAYKRMKNCPVDWEMRRKVMKEFRQMQRNVSFLARNRIQTYSELMEYKAKAEEILKHLKEQRKELQKEYKPYQDKFLALKEYDRLEQMDELYLAGYEAMKPEHEKRERIAELMDVEEVRRVDDEFKQQEKNVNTQIYEMRKRTKCLMSIEAVSAKNITDRQEKNGCITEKNEEIISL